MSEKFIVGESGNDSFKRNYNKMEIFSGILRDKKVFLVDGEEEYKSLSEYLGIEYNKIES